MKSYLGIDVGGMTIKSALVDIDAAIVSEKQEIPTPKNKKDFLEALRSIIETSDKSLKGVGVGLPGMIDRAHGMVLNAPHLKFLNKWNARTFFETFDFPVKIDNDSRCFLRAEWVAGAAKGYTNVVGIAVGTGIGGGIVVDGQMYYGAHDSAGEFGHMLIEKNTTLEAIGGKAAYETLGDRSAVIGIGVANIINACDPEIVVLGGGGIFKGDINIKTVQTTARMYIKSPPAKKTPIVKGKYGIWAQALGAAMLFKY